MLTKISLKPEQVHRIKAENPDPEKDAQEYEQLLTSFAQFPSVLITCARLSTY
jgi:6-phosphogluconolactonase/glucosamine-6-phosphate isomerase/deaminase